MDFPILVDSALTLPIIAPPTIADDNSSMIVTFEIPPIYECLDEDILVTLCVVVNINDVIHSLYKSTTSFASLDPIDFDFILPIGSIILDAIPTYTILYGGF